MSLAGVKKSYYNWKYTVVKFLYKFFKALALFSFLVPVLFAYCMVNDGFQRDLAYGFGKFFDCIKAQPVKSIGVLVLGWLFIVVILYFVFIKRLAVSVRIAYSDTLSATENYNDSIRLKEKNREYDKINKALTSSGPIDFKTEFQLMDIFRNGTNYMLRSDDGDMPYITQEALYGIKSPFDVN